MKKTIVLAEILSQEKLAPEVNKIIEILTSMKEIEELGKDLITSKESPKTAIALLLVNISLPSINFFINEC